MKFILLINLIIGQYAFAVPLDYKKCQTFINKNMKRLGVNFHDDIPFTIDEKGVFTKSTSSNLTHYEVSKDTFTETYKMKNRVGFKNRGLSEETVYTVEKNEDGSIKKIIQRHTNDKDSVENLKVQTKNSTDSGLEAPVKARSGYEIEFDYKNNICVPKDQGLVLLDKDAAPTLSILSNTEFCRDMENFIKNNPDIKSCFSKETQQKLSTLFEKYEAYYKGSVTSKDGIEKFNPDPIAYEKLNESAMYSSLEETLASQKENSIGALGNLTFSMKQHQIACQMFGLKPFVDDENIWAEKTDEAAKVNSKAETK